MASLAEVADRINNPALAARVQAAVIVTAVSVGFEDPAAPNHAARLAWSKAAIQDHVGTAVRVVKYILAANKGLTASQLDNLDDQAILDHSSASLAILAAPSVSI